MSYILEVKKMLKRALDPRQWRFQGKEGSIDYRNLVFEGKVESIYGPLNEGLYCAFYMTKKQPLRLCFDNKGDKSVVVEAAVSFRDYLRTINDKLINRTLIERSDTRSTLSFHVDISNSGIANPSRPVIDVGSAKKLVRLIEETIPKWLETLMLPYSRSGQQYDSIASELEKAGEFSPKDVDGEHQKTYRSTALRPRQSAFRKALLVAYKGRCAITGCEVLDVLEAAHIYPYRGEETNHVQNGLLLRTDIHTLFDLGKIAIEPENLTVMIDGSLMNSDYADLHGKRLNMPDDPRQRPSKEALKWRREQNRVARME